MKKIMFNLLLILCMVLLPMYNVVLADEFEFSVHPEPAVVDASGDTVKLKFIVSTGENSTGLITNCSFKVNAPSGVTFVEDESPNGWNIDTGVNGYLLDSSDGVNEGVIMNSIYKVNSNSTITVSNIECGNADEDITYTVKDDIKVSVKIADTVNIKVDGVAVGGQITNPLAASKNDFVLSVVAGDASIQSNVKVEMLDTATGTNEICTGENCKEVTVNFNSENYCVSAECISIKPTIGDNVMLRVSVNGTENKTFHVIKELTNEETLDASIKYLKVWGIEVELKPDQTVYSHTVPANVTDYTVVAELSDPENFVWDEEDKPSKYNFKTDTINLILRPKDTEAVGAKEVVYVININQDGADNKSSSSKPAASSNKPSSNYKPSSSNNAISNPQTSGISQFIVAIVLFVSLAFVLNLYKKNMEEYK